MTDLHLCCLFFCRTAAPPPPHTTTTTATPPIPLWVLQRMTEGWTDLHDGGSKEGARENTSAEKKEGGKWKSRGVGSWEVTRAVQGTPNQCCVNRPPPRVDRLHGGVLHGPLGLSAEQITDGRNVAFVLKKRENRREGGRKEEEFNWWLKAGPPINIYLIHSYSWASCSLSPAAAFLLAHSSLLFLGFLCSHRDLLSSRHQPEVHGCALHTLPDS